MLQGCKTVTTNQPTTIIGPSELFVSVETSFDDCPTRDPSTDSSQKQEFVVNEHTSLMPAIPVSQLAQYIQEQKNSPDAFTEEFQVTE